MTDTTKLYLEDIQQRDLGFISMKPGELYLVKRGLRSIGYRNQPQLEGHKMTANFSLNSSTLDFTGITEKKS